MKQPSILLVDDDRTLLRFLGEYLTQERFYVITAQGGRNALRSFYQERPDLVVLDVMMPGMDGWEVCARLRELSDTPIIMLTAKVAEADKLRGFRLGVDDYVTKPFSFAELAARIRAVLVRSKAGMAEDEIYVVGDLEVDLRRREAMLGNQLLRLTPKEFRLLSTLAHRAGEAVSNEQLVRAIWGDVAPASQSALRRHISQLRSKIEVRPSSSVRLVTVRGYGYRLEAED
jgi:two-component system OmpR family response regulator